jgi:hypothetical protein
MLEVHALASAATCFIFSGESCSWCLKREMLRESGKVGGPRFGKRGYLFHLIRKILSMVRSSGRYFPFLLPLTSCALCFNKGHDSSFVYFCPVLDVLAVQGR